MKETREIFSKRIFLLMAVLILLCFTQILYSTTKTDVNILLITVDTLRADVLSCYSKRFGHTPNIDQLAARGTIFTRAIAHNPTTLPSHTNIMLGTTPLFHGIHDNAMFRVGPDFLTLAEHIKSNGYSTGAFIGAFPLDSRFGLDQGFEIYDDKLMEKSEKITGYFGFSERISGDVIASALAWLDGRSSPWFIWLHLWDPHEPYVAPEPFKSMYREKPYFSEVAYVDSEIGKLLDYMENRDLVDSTLFILTGDHGESLGEHGEYTHGYFAYNSTLHVPLIISGPGVRTGKVSDFVSHTDLFPTICDLLGLHKPTYLQGISLLPALKGRGLPARKIYFESLSSFLNRGWAPLRGFIDTQSGQKFIESPIPELYDLKKDFTEARNLADRADINNFKKNLKDLSTSLASLNRASGRRKIAREVMEKLNSLGYFVSPLARPPEQFGADIDLKTLLPLHKRLRDAIELYNRGKLEESIRMLRQITQERRDFDSAYLHLCQALQNMGRINEAMAAFESGVNSNPESYLILSSFGSLLIENGNIDRGIEILNRAAALVDFDTDIWNSLGIAYWQKGLEELAIKDLKTALTLNPRSSTTLNNLGTVYLSLFQKTSQRDLLDKAQESYRKSIEIDPLAAAGYNGMGAVMRYKGRVDDAILNWERALEIEPQYEFTIYNLAVAYLDRGTNDKSLELLGRYLSVKGSSLSPTERAHIRSLIQKCLNDI